MKKIVIFAHTFTVLSFIFAIVSAILITPYAITGLVSTALIFNTAEKIRRREARLEDNTHR